MGLFQRGVWARDLNLGGHLFWLILPKRVQKSMVLAVFPLSALIDFEDNLLIQTGFLGFG
jgi:hypothetical protein